MNIAYRLLAVLGALAAACAVFPAAGHCAEPVPAVRDLDRFTVEVRGQGPDVIFIPGLASSRDVWSGVAGDLARTRRVHLVQIAGFAGLPAGPNAEGPMLDPIVADLHAYIVREQLKAPAVVGHSLGGLLGLKLAAAHPGDVGRLMVVDAVPYLSAMTDPAVTAEKAQAGAVAMRDRVLGLSEADFATMQQGTARYMTKTADWQPKVAAWTLATDRKVMAKAMYEDLIDDARAGLPAIKAPVIVLYAWDATMPYPAPAADAVYAASYQGLAGVKLVRVDGAYHFLMLDQPERFAAELKAFLN